MDDQFRLMSMPDENYTVTHLMDIFRRSLVALAPLVESIGIPWRDEDLSDDWEAIEEHLFWVMVACTIQGDVGLCERTLGFAPYGNWRPISHRELSWIEVDVPDREGTFALVRLGSPHDFGTIHTVRLDLPGAVDEKLSVAWTSDRTFAARLRAEDGTLNRVEEVTPTDSAVSWGPILPGRTPSRNFRTVRTGDGGSRRGRIRGLLGGLQ